MSLQTDIAKARILMHRAEERFRQEEARLHKVRAELDAAQAKFYVLLSDAGLCLECEKPDCTDPRHHCVLVGLPQTSVEHFECIVPTCLVSVGASHQ